MKKKKDNWGGARVGAGPKPKYGETTVNISFRVPESQRTAIRDLVNNFLKKLITGDR